MGLGQDLPDRSQAEEVDIGLVEIDLEEDPGPTELHFIIDEPVIGRSINCQVPILPKERTQGIEDLEEVLQETCH